MNSLPITPRRFIKDLAKLQQFQCTICFEVQPTLMRCNGPCKAIICLSCASSICSTTNSPKCPHRCSDQLVLQQIPNLQLHFSCPYDQEKCKADIKGRAAFMDHLICCQYITTEALRNNLRSEEHLCDKDHSLLFIDNQVSARFMQKMTLANITFKCSACHETKICRSFCGQCSTEGNLVAYCHQCRKLPCTKTICPNGIHLFERRQSSIDHFCDMCSNNISLISAQLYQDQQCNIGICTSCYNKLPESHHLVPLQSNILHKMKNKQVEPAFNGVHQLMIGIQHPIGWMGPFHNYHNHENVDNQEHSSEEQAVQLSQNDSEHLHMGGHYYPQEEENEQQHFYQQQNHEQDQFQGEGDQHQFQQSEQEEEEMNMHDFAGYQENEYCGYQQESDFDDFYDE